MTARAIDWRLDYNVYAEWHTEHGLNAPRLEDMPVCGAIVPGLAAGILYRTDSSFAVLDGFVSNKNAPLRKRTAALYEVEKKLEELAKSHGYSRVMAITTATGTQRLAHKAGAKTGAMGALVFKEL